jgi:transposase
LTIHIRKIAKKSEIKERRKQVESMLAQSMTEQQIADVLKVDRTTISKDFKAIKDTYQQSAHNLAQSELAYYYMQCINTIQEAERIVWETYRNKKRFSTAEVKERCLMAKTIIDSAQTRFSLFKDGPGLMQIKAIRERIDEIEIGSK